MFKVLQFATSIKLLTALTAYNYPTVVAAGNVDLVSDLQTGGRTRAEPDKSGTGHKWNWT